MLDAINWLENKLGWVIEYKIDETRARKRDHIWYTSGVRKFQNDYPNWKCQYSVEDILTEMTVSSLAIK